MASRGEPIQHQSFGTGTSLTGITVLVHRLNPGHRNL
jgi:hypothetical protein